ncbi:hypothetical protein SEA_SCOOBYDOOBYDOO_42 [Mycobacterium phage ScoobyDoobyDoo]|nr:hypothetical protein SEA_SCOOBYDOOBYDOO_42 [Mycobacterium phage ScoobyDoobyDoo]
MSNATATQILAAATAIVDHDGYVAFWSNEANITAYVRTQVDADDIAAAQTGGYYAQARIASDVARYTRYEGMTDAQLHAELDELSRTEDWNEFEGKWEYGQSDYAWHLIDAIEDLLAYRRYTSAEALTQRPFAALAVAA